MEKYIKITSYKEQAVGKAFKSSKTKYEWIFYLNGKKNVVELLKSSMSGKMRVLLNEELIHYEQKFLGDNFHFQYKTGNLALRIDQLRNKYDLIVKQTGNLGFSSSKDQKLQGRNSLNLNRRKSHGIDVGSPYERQRQRNSMNGNKRRSSQRPNPYLNSTDGHPSSTQPVHRKHFGGTQGGLSNTKFYDGDADIGFDSAIGSNYGGGNQAVTGFSYIAPQPQGRTVASTKKRSKKRRARINSDDIFSERQVIFKSLYD